MSFLLALGLYFLIIFAVFYGTKRNVGMPALGLSAGYVLANMWTLRATERISDAGVVLTSPPLQSVVAIVLTLLPALIIIGKATKAHGRTHRLYSSLIFALLAVTLTYTAFASTTLDSTSSKILVQILPYDSIVTTLCIALALVDVLYHRKHKVSGAHKK